MTFLLCTLFNENCFQESSLPSASQDEPIRTTSVTVNLCSCELDMCSSERYLWTGIIFYKYVFCFVHVLLSCLVFLMFLLFCGGNVSELCLLIYYFIDY